MSSASDISTDLPLALPFDILFLLISQLDPIEDRCTLAAWASTALSFRRAAQARLYSAVRVNFNLVQGQLVENIPSTQLFLRTVLDEESCHFAKVVRHLEICLNIPPITNVPATRVTPGFALDLLVPRLTNLRECVISTAHQLSFFKTIGKPEQDISYTNSISPRTHVGFRMVLGLHPLELITIKGFNEFPVTFLCSNPSLRILEIPSSFTSQLVDTSSKSPIYLTSLTISGHNTLQDETRRASRTLSQPGCPLKLNRLKELYIIPKLALTELSSILALCSDELTHLTMKTPQTVVYMRPQNQPLDSFASSCHMVDLDTFTNLSHLVINSVIIKERPSRHTPFVNTGVGSPGFNPLERTSISGLGWIGAMLATLRSTEHLNPHSLLRLNLSINNVQIQPGRIPWMGLIDQLLRLETRFKRIEVVISFKDQFIPFTTRNDWYNHLKNDSSLARLGSRVSYDSVQHRG